MKKIKDLPPNTKLEGVKVKTLDGQIGYWCSQWSKGVFLSLNSKLEGRIFPVLLSDLKEALEWEVIEDETITPNLET